jgi:hypothetical protein
MKIHGSCHVWSSDPSIKRVVFGFKLNGSPRVVNGSTHRPILPTLIASHQATPKAQTKKKKKSLAVEASWTTPKRPWSGFGHPRPAHSQASRDGPATTYGMVGHHLVFF